MLSELAFVDAARHLLADEDERKESELLMVAATSSVDVRWQMQLKTLRVLAERLPAILDPNEQQDKALASSVEKLCKLLLKKLKKSSVKIGVRQAIGNVFMCLARSSTGLVTSSDGETNVQIECIKSALEVCINLLSKSSGDNATSLDGLKFIGILIECGVACAASLGVSALDSLSQLFRCCLQNLEVSSGVIK